MTNRMSKESLLIWETLLLKYGEEELACLEHLLDAAQCLPRPLFVLDQ